MNFQCKDSIYNQTVGVPTLITLENLTAMHTCTCCHQPLSSAIDLEIKNTMAEVNQGKFIKINYQNN